MATTLHDHEYFRYSNFVGGLLNVGALKQHDAQVMLVDAFWEKERANSADDGVNLDAQVRDRYPDHRRETFVVDSAR